jgi:hypothetical protein
MTPQEVITEARNILQDVRVPFRYVDSLLLGLVNLTLKRLSILRPDLFVVMDDIPTVANTVVQSLPANSMRLVEIFQVKGGNAVTEAVREVYDQTLPGWVNEPVGPTRNYMRHPRNPNRFFIYPKAPENLILVGEFAQSPRSYGLAEEIDLVPDSFLPVLVDGTVFMAESIDNEHVNNNRAKLFQDIFNETIALSLQARALTDTETAGQNPKEVLS